MKKLVSRVVVFALAITIVSLAGAPEANAGGHAPHFQKPPALRKAQALHKAKKQQKKMQVKHGIFH